MHTPNNTAADQAASNDTSTLRRITPLSEWRAPVDAGPPVMTVAVLDLETTGFDPQFDEIIKLPSLSLSSTNRGTSSRSRT
jgi:DNA polymerase-3 subunit epsilon